MLILALIFVLLTAENLKSVKSFEHNEDFYVEVNKSNLYGSQSLETIKNSEEETLVFYDIGDTIVLTCSYYQGEDKNSIIRWIDNYKFGTAEHRETLLNKTALRLIIIPDRDDDGLTLTCQAYKKEDKMKNSISVKLDLDVKAETGRLKPASQTVDREYRIKEGESLQNNATCNSIVQVVQLPTKKVAAATANFASFLINEIIIPEFGTEENGTIVSCVTYSNSDTDFKQGLTYKRLKDKTIYYLETDSEMSSRDEHKQKRTKESNTISIVGGALGVMILISILVILVIWHKKNRHNPRDEASDQVICAEIEERSHQVSPPVSYEPPYAKIMGTLVPKHPPPPRVDEPLYCQITT